MHPVPILSRCYGTTKSIGCDVKSKREKSNTYKILLVSKRNIKFSHGLVTVQVIKA